MSDPNRERGLSVTIKFPESARYKADNPWMVFHGSPATIREDIIDAFNLGDEAKELALHELVQEAQSIVTGMGNAASGLGGRVLSPGSGSAWSQAQSGQRAEKAPEKSPEEIEVERLTAAVEAVTTVADLQQLWARNQAPFAANEALMTAYKAKGKALSAG